MSLGLARDSVLDLAALAHQEEEREQRDTLPTENDDDFFLIDDDEENTAQDQKPNASCSTGVSYSQALPKANFPTEEKKEEKPFEDEPASDDGSQVQAAQASMYSGFSSDYHEYEDYYNQSMMYGSYHDPYAASYGQYEQQKKKNIFCCLMPWLQNEDEFTSDDESSGHFEQEKGGLDIAGTEKVAAEATTLTETPKEAVNRDDLQKIEMIENTPTNYDNLLNNKDKETLSGDKMVDDLTEKSEKAPPKGILKHTVCQLAMRQSMEQASSTKSFGVSNTKKEENSTSRRMLFPAYEPKCFGQSVDTSVRSDIPAKNVTFAPMARVTTVSGRKEMTFMDRSKIWWQRSDYEDFKKTGRIIAKAMLEGGSEIWLQTSDAWGAKQHASQNAKNYHSDEYKRALKTFSGRSHELDDEMDSPINENKWWCKFGHSRRGLEHVVTAEEGRQRQKNVNLSISSVVDEQRRQRMSRSKDAKKLAQVYMNYTHWARDLAIASGSADAHAVSSNFNQDFKTRSYFLRQNSKDNPSKKMESLNEPSLLAILDANTPTNIILRQQEFIRHESKSSREFKPTSRSLAVGTVPVNGPSPSSESIAKKAAGFSADGEKTLIMSGVLSGLGSVKPNMAQTVGAH